MKSEYMMAIGAASIMLIALFAVGYSRGNDPDADGMDENLASALDEPELATGSQDLETASHKDCECDAEEAGDGADVGVEKSAESDRDADGGLHTARFTITVTSLGDSTALNVVLTDHLPDLQGNQWDLYGPDAADCSIDEMGTLTCMFGDLDPGESRTVSVVMHDCDFDCGPDVVNEATVAADNDGNETNNHDEAVIELEDCPTADVSVEKTGTLTLDDQDELAGKVSFTITVRSVGSVAAEGVTLHDELPVIPTSQWHLSGPDADDCDLAEGVLTCDFGTMAPGETREVTVTSARCFFHCDDRIENTAVVSADNDAEHRNNRDTAVVELPPCAAEPEGEDADMGALLRGNLVNHERTLGSVTYTVTLENFGPGVALNVRSQHLLPDLPGTTTWTIGGDDSSACGRVGNTIHCTFGDVQPGDTVTYTVSTTRSEVGCTPFDSSVEVGSDNDPNPDNNEDSVTLTPDLCPDVSVQKDGAHTTEGGFDVITWTITVRSIGNGWAHDTVLTDPLPFVGADWELGGPDAGDCTLEDDTVTCAFGVLAPGESRTITVRSDLCVIDDSVTNTAFVTAEGDINDNNNSDSATVTS